MRNKIILSIIGLLVLVSIVFYKEIKNTLKYYYISSKFKLYKNNGKCPNCEIMFTDGVAEHKKAYIDEGIQAQKTNKDLNILLKKNVLVKIESNQLYFVRNLTHSKPYLLPKASDFILKLCTEYSDSCTKNNLDYIPVLITSATRTIESVKQLKIVNANAIRESAHLKGKTFDISYKHFSDNDQQMILLAKILKKYADKELCFVKYERNGCLHITVN